MAWEVMGFAHAHLAHVAAHARVAARNAQHEAGTDSNRDLRVRFLAGDIDDAAFSALLQRREKARFKAVAVAQVQEAFVAAATDIFNNLLATAYDVGLRSAKGVVDAVRQLEVLRDFHIEAAAAAQRRFGSLRGRGLP